MSNITRTINFLNVSVQIEGAAKKPQTTLKTGTLGGRSFAKSSSISVHRYSAITVKFLDWLSKTWLGRVANMKSNEERIFTDTSEGDPIYLSRNDMKAVTRELEEQEEAQLPDWLKTWKEATKATSQAALPVFQQLPNATPDATSNRLTPEDAEDGNLINEDEDGADIHSGGEQEEELPGDSEGFFQDQSNQNQTTPADVPAVPIPHVSVSIVPLQSLGTSALGTSEAVKPSKPEKSTSQKNEGRLSIGQGFTRVVKFIKAKPGETLVLGLMGVGTLVGMVAVAGRNSVGRQPAGGSSGTEVSKYFEEHSYCSASGNISSVRLPTDLTPLSSEPIGTPNSVDESPLVLIDKLQVELPQAEAEQPAKSQTASEKAETRNEEAPKVEEAEKAQAEAEKAQAEKAQAEKAQAEKAQAEKVQAEKAQAEAEKVQAEKAQAEKTQAEKVQAEKAQAEAEKVQAEKAAIEAAQKAEADAKARDAQKAADAQQAQAEQEAAIQKAADAQKAQKAPEEAESEFSRRGDALKKEIKEVKELIAAEKAAAAQKAAAQKAADEKTKAAQEAAAQKAADEKAKADAAKGKKPAETQPGSQPVKPDASYEQLAATTGKIVGVVAVPVLVAIALFKRFRNGRAAKAAGPRPAGVQAAAVGNPAGVQQAAAVGNPAGVQQAAAGNLVGAVQQAAAAGNIGDLGIAKAEKYTATIATAYAHPPRYRRDLEDCAFKIRTHRIGAVAIGNVIYKETKGNCSIGLEVACNPGRAGGGIWTLLFWEETPITAATLSFGTQEEEVLAALFLKVCGEDYDKQVKFYNQILAAAWGMRDGQQDDSQNYDTFQDINYKALTDADKFNLCFILKNCQFPDVDFVRDEKGMEKTFADKKGKTRKEKQITNETCPLKLFFAGAPNGNEIASFEPLSSVRRTYTPRADNPDDKDRLNAQNLLKQEFTNLSSLDFKDNAQWDTFFHNLWLKNFKCLYQFFYKGLENSSRTSLSAMADEQISHPILALKGCGLYAPRDPLDGGEPIFGVIDTYEEIINGILHEEVGPNRAKTGEYFADVTLAKLSNWRPPYSDNWQAIKKKMKRILVNIKSLDTNKQQNALQRLGVIMTTDLTKIHANLDNLEALLSNPAAFNNQAQVAGALEEKGAPKALENTNPPGRRRRNKGRPEIHGVGAVVVRSAGVPGPKLAAAAAPQESLQPFAADINGIINALNAKGHPDEKLPLLVTTTQGDRFCIWQEESVPGSGKFDIINLILSKELRSLLEGKSEKITLKVADDGHISCSNNGKSVLDKSFFNDVLKSIEKASLDLPAIYLRNLEPLVNTSKIDAMTVKSLLATILLKVVDLKVIRDHWLPWLIATIKTDKGNDIITSFYNKANANPDLPLKLPAEQAPPPAGPVDAGRDAPPRFKGDLLAPAMKRAGALPRFIGDIGDTGLGVAHAPKNLPRLDAPLRVNNEDGSLNGPNTLHASINALIAKAGIEPGRTLRTIDYDKKTGEIHIKFAGRETNQADQFFELLLKDNWVTNEDIDKKIKNVDKKITIRKEKAEKFLSDLCLFPLKELLASLPPEQPTGLTPEGLALLARMGSGGALSEHVPPARLTGDPGLGLAKAPAAADMLSRRSRFGAQAAAAAPAAAPAAPAAAPAAVDPAKLAMEALVPREIIANFDPANNEHTVALKAYLQTDPNDNNFNNIHRFKLMQFAKLGNANAINWLAKQTYQRMMHDKKIQDMPICLDDTCEIEKGSFGSLLYIALKEDNQKAFQAFLENGSKCISSAKGNGYSDMKSYSISFYQKHGELAEYHYGMPTVKSPPHYTLAEGKIDVKGIIARAVIESFEIATGVQLKDKDVLVDIPLSDDGKPTALIVKFGPQVDDKILDRFVVHSSDPDDKFSPGSWDGGNRYLSISEDQIENFLRRTCRVVPYMLFESIPINQLQDNIIAAEALSEKIHVTLSAFGVPFRTQQGINGNWHVVFMPQDDASKDQLVSSIRNMWPGFSTNEGRYKPALGEEHWQIKKVAKQGDEDKKEDEAIASEGWEVSLSSNETYYILGFPKGKASFNELMQKQSQWEYVEAQVAATPIIDQQYTSKVSYQEQLSAHLRAKKGLVEDLQKIGAEVTFMHLPEGQGMPEMDKIKLPSEGGDPLQMNIKWNNGGDVLAAVKEAGSSNPDEILLINGASQFTGTESPSVYMAPMDKAVETYNNDPTQGPRSQLPFGQMQIKTLLRAAHRGFNGLISILSDRTKNSTQHGYFMPHEEHMKEILGKLKNEGHKVEFIAVKNRTAYGPNDVHLLLTAAPASAPKYYQAGEVGNNMPKDPKEVAELQYGCAYIGTSAQIDYALQVAKTSPNKIVHVALGGTGMGEFQNGPLPVAKGTYAALKAREKELSQAQNIKITFEIYRGNLNSPSGRVVQFLGVEEDPVSKQKSQASSQAGTGSFW